MKQTVNAKIGITSGGFDGSQLTKKPEKAPFDVVSVDKHTIILFTPCFTGLPLEP